MRAEARFLGQPIRFWAYVRTITEALGSSRRGADRVTAFGFADLEAGLLKAGRSTAVLGTKDQPSRLAYRLIDYFQYRAKVLNESVRADLMAADEAKALFNETLATLGATGPTEVLDRSGKKIAVDFIVDGHPVRVPMNKQTGDKRAPAFLTGLVNLVATKHLDGREWDSDPRSLPSIDRQGELWAVLSRRMDGSFPSTSNPIAMWEIKEYYYTTTFGSKISDAVYITALDGYERLEVEQETETPIYHMIIVDAYEP